MLQKLKAFEIETAAATLKLQGYLQPATVGVTP